MLYIRFSPNRLFIINEYWLLVPPMLVIDYLIITQIIKIKKSKDKNIKSKKDYQTKYQQLKIFHLAMNNIVDILRIRGGQELIEITYPECGVGKGFRYIDHQRLRKLVYFLYKFKERNGVIFITQTALCHLVKKYGLLLPAFLPMKSPAIMTDWYQFIRKAVVTILIGGAIPMALWAETVAYIALSFTLGGAGIALSLTNRDFPIVPTTLISGAVESIKRRIPDVPEVVSVNFEIEPTNRIEMSNKRYECLLPEHRLTDPTCRMKNIEIAEISNNIGLDYNDVVNMYDVTGLDTVEFTDRYSFTDRSQVSSSTETVQPKHRLRGTTVNFLDKFGDPQNVPESETWDIDTNSFERIANKKHE